MSGFKRCPKCSLVHSESETVCRRCRVDLLTGAPAPVAAPRTSTLSEVLAERLADSTALVRRPFSKAGALFNRIAGKVHLPKLKASEAVELQNLAFCMACGGEMKPATEPYYQFKVLFPLLGLSVVLFGVGFRFHLLFIPAVLSLACFFLYFRLRMEVHICTECGKRVAMRKPKKAAAQGIETSST